MKQAHITTSHELPGVTILHPVGIVRGIAIADARGSDGAFMGPDIKSYSELLEWAFATAQYNMMLKAEKLEANAIVSVRFESMQNKFETIEVVAYGTAVIVKESEDELPPRECMSNELTEMPRLPKDPESMDAIGND